MEGGGSVIALKDCGVNATVTLVGGSNTYTTISTTQGHAYFSVKPDTYLASSDGVALTKTIILEQGQDYVETALDGLPTQYTRLEYIESRESGCIDTQYLKNYNDYVYLDMLFYGSGNPGWASIAGCDIKPKINLMFQNSYDKICFQNDNSYGSTINRNNKRTIWTIHDKTCTWLDYETQATGSLSAGSNCNCNYSFTIGCAPNTYNDGVPSPTYSIAHKLYGFKVENLYNVLKVNLVPCIRNADSICGMYDTLSGNFHTNVFVNGSGYYPPQD